jgi:hypothetical protein
MFQVGQKVKVEIDAETFNILCAIAKASNKTTDELLKMLTSKYKQMNAIERWGMIQFLRG